MASFAIKRWDGEIHVVQAASLEDAANTYGWPGNGTIEPYDAATHADGTTARFANVTEHNDFLASKEYQDAQASKADKLVKAAAKAAAGSGADSDNGSETDNDSEGN